MQHEFSQPSFADINGAQIAYDVQGSGQLLLLLHAGIADRRMWEPQFEALARHFKTVRFDFRGFGQTNMPPGEFSNVDDVIGLMDFFESESAMLVGCSFGGLIAFDVTACHPERVHRLAVIGTSIGGHPPSDAIREGWSEEEALIESGDLDGATAVNVRMWVDGPDRNAADVDTDVRSLVFRMQRDAFDHHIPEDANDPGVSPPSLDRVEQIHTPTLLLVGEHDYPEKIALTRSLGTRMPHAQSAVISGGAHMVGMEQPQVVNERLLEFLS